MLEGLQKRENNIQSAVEDARKSKEEAQRLRDEIQAERNKIEDARRDIIQKAQADAQRLADEISARTKAEMQAERDRARRESQDRHVQRRHPRAGGETVLSALEIRDRLLKHRPVAVGVTAVVMTRPLAPGNGVVVLEIRVDVDRGEAQVRRERAPGDQFAAGVNRPRCRFHGKLEPCA